MFQKKNCCVSPFNLLNFILTICCLVNCRRLIVFGAKTFDAMSFEETHFQQKCTYISLGLFIQVDQT